MTAMHSDTHPDAEAVQLELLRHASVAQRACMMRGLTRMAVASSRRAIAKARPGLSQQELDLVFVELNYGQDLADRVRQWMAS
jgi:hypothetical protein